jgi:3-dehydroquinate synthase
LAEVIKYGLIRDPEFFVWLEINLEKLLARDQAALIYAVHRSCTNKAEVVAADERESGERALLNLGHTFGHAIETGSATASGFMEKRCSRHANCCGVVMQFWGGSMLKREANRSLFVRAGLPVLAPRLVYRDLELMSHDKKVQDGKLRLVLLEDWQAVVSDAGDVLSRLVQLLKFDAPEWGIERQARDWCGAAS